MNKYYYRFDEEGKLGNAMRKFWHDCIKADEAAERWAMKFGGEGAAYYQDPNFFAGSVAYVSFPAEQDVNPLIWKECGEVNGEKVWQPNCLQRTDVIIVPRRGFIPSNTAHRIYDKKWCRWQEVQLMHTTGEWAEMAHIDLSDDTEANKRLVNETMQKYAFIKYLEFYGGEEAEGHAALDLSKTGKRNKRSEKSMPWTLRKAIEAERQRINLPVVSVVRLYAMLGAKGEADKKEQKQEAGTPTFFNYGGRYYIGIDRECESLALESITPELYQKKKTEAMLAEKYNS